MRLRAATLALAASAFCGCASDFVPPNRDTLAELGRPGAGLWNMSAAVVLSQKTQDSMRYNSASMSSVPSFMPGAWFAGMAQRFSSRFKQAVRADSVEAARGTGADIIAVVDDYAAVTIGALTQRYQIDMGVIFLTPDLQKIAEVRGERLDEARIWSYGSADKAVARVEKSFYDALAASGALASYAQSRKAPPAQAPPVAARAPEPLPPALAPSFQLKENPADFAVVIGVEGYKDLPPAQYAERDAEAVRAHIRALGVPTRNTVLLTGSDATRTGMQKYVEEWLPRNVTPESRVFFYFSGHGAPDPGSGEAYLVPWDGDPRFLKSTAYSLKQLYSALQRLPARNVVTLLDACFSGAGGRSVLAKGARPLVVRVEEPAAPDGALKRMSAASNDEITSTLESRKHGIFTYYLLEGLNGGAKDAQGRVTAAGLFSYLKPKVQDEARLQNREQTPTLHTASDVVLRD